MSPRSCVIPEPPPEPGTYGLPLSRVYTWATDSNVSADDLPGAGRVVGNFLVWGGKHVDTLGTKLSLMLGGGPNAPLRTLLKSLRCKQCSNAYFGNELAWLPRHASADFVLRELFIRSVSCASCHSNKGFAIYSEKKISKAGKGFAKIIRGSNISSQYSAILYITALASIIPDLRAVFMKYNTTRALAVLRSRIAQQPDDDIDFLLAPSHCALAILSEIEIHAIGKDIITLNERILATLNGEAPLDTLIWEFNVKQPAFTRSRLYGELLTFWKTSQTAILIAMILRTGVNGDERAFTSHVVGKWPIDYLYEEYWGDIFQFDYADLVHHLAHSEDPVLNSMLPALLLSIRENLLVNFRCLVQHHVDEGRTPRRSLRTLDILESADWEMLLGNNLNKDEFFEVPWSDCSDEEDELGSSAGSSPSEFGVDIDPDV